MKCMSKFKLGALRLHVFSTFFKKRPFDSGDKVHNDIFLQKAPFSTLERPLLNFTLICILQKTIHVLMTD